MKFIVIALLIATLFVGYNIYQQKAGEIKFENGMVNILKQNGEKISVNIKIADNPRERAKGLMFVKEMPENEGMLFIFDQEEMRKMWMENTYISLDMLFVNSKKEIFNFKENTTPLSRDIIYSVGPAKYVVELNAGFIKKHNIQIGDLIEF